MRKSLLFIVPAIACLLLFFAPSSTTTIGSAEAAVQEPSPKSPPESTPRARQLYTYDCAVCHGEKGDGKGDMSADFPGKIRDWTDPASLKDFNDEQLLTIIRDGAGDMPPEGKRAKKNELLALVGLVRSFAKH